MVISTVREACPEVEVWREHLLVFFQRADEILLKAEVSLEKGRSRRDKLHVGGMFVHVFLVEEAFAFFGA